MSGRAPRSVYCSCQTREQVRDLFALKLAERQVVLRAVADDARDARAPGGCGRCRSAAPDLGRVGRDARVVVVEDEGARVVGVALAADAHVAGAEVAVRQVLGQLFLGVLHRPAAPRSILTVRRDDHPLFAQRVPALFPGHNLSVAPLAAHEDTPGPDYSRFSRAVRRGRSACSRARIKLKKTVVDERFNVYCDKPKTPVCQGYSALPRARVDNRSRGALKTAGERKSGIRSCREYNW